MPKGVYIRTPEYFEALKRGIAEANKRPEVRAARSAAHKGKKLSRSHRKAISEAGKGRIQSKECRKKIGLSNAIVHSRPETIERKSISITKALRRPEIRKKHLKAIEERNKRYPHKFSGGNGQPPIPYIVQIAKILEPAGFVREYRISRQSKKGGCYTLDFAHVEGKIDIECDGRSHGKIGQRKKDQERDKFLKNLGWKVIRVKYD